MSYSIFSFDNIVDAQNVAIPNTATQVNTLFTNPSGQQYKRVYLTNNDPTNSVYLNFSVNGAANVSSTKFAILLTAGDSHVMDAGRGAVAQMWGISSAGTPALNLIFGA